VLHEGSPAPKASKAVKAKGSKNGSPKAVLTPPKPKEKKKGTVVGCAPQKNLKIKKCFGARSIFQFLFRVFFRSQVQESCGCDTSTKK
jgi:hypothetical protein